MRQSLNSFFDQLSQLSVASVVKKMLRPETSGVSKRITTEDCRGIHRDIGEDKRFSFYNPVKYNITMITRIWHGKTKTEFAAVYRQYVIDTGMRDYINTPGNMGAQLWQREDGEITEIWTVSWWQDYESIKMFAGEEFEKAHYYEEDKKYLLLFEPTVMHCEAYDFPAKQV